jgi:hypothetical protein
MAKLPPFAKHAADTAAFNQHGHAFGKQGADGHLMPENDHHMQSGATVQQGPHNPPSSSAGSKNPTGNKIPASNDTEGDGQCGDNPND